MADVGCAGILVADTFCGPMPALPRPGELLAVDAMPSKAGGCAANVAIDLAKQGFDVDVAGCVGNDAAARIVLSSLGAYRIGCRHILPTDAYPTSTTVILLVEGEDRRYVHAFGANTAFTVAQVDRKWVRELKVFYLGGLLAMPGIRIPELGELLAFCRHHGVTTVVDVAVPQGYAETKEFTRLLPYIDYFTPNEDEARRLTGASRPLDQLCAFADHGANTVIVTRGTAGAVAGRGGKCWSTEAYLLPAVDPSGAGDAFTSGVITGILRGWGLDQTLPYAAALGASAIRAVGTTDSVFTAADAMAFVASHPLRVDVRPLR